MRKTIAKRLAESKFTAPHFYVTMEINMDKAVEARKSINEISPVKISFNDMVIKAVAAALRQHPDVNVSWLGDKMRKNHHIHIGVAVAVKDGLLVPVIRFADNKSLSHIAAEVKDLAQKAHDKKLQPSDWEGSTFTVSNLGMFGVEEFTAIINPPDACILAVGGIKETAIVKNGQLVPGNVMKVTLSCDHRAVDGAVGAAFLKTFKGLMEDPVRISYLRITFIKPRSDPGLFISHDMEKIHSTTILAVLHNGQIAIGGDGQATMGNYVAKSNVEKYASFRMERYLPDLQDLLPMHLH